MAKTFKYGGYTFESRGQFKDFGIKAAKNRSELINITSALHFADWNNRFKVADGNERFDYDEFYMASGGSNADVFYCQETGEMYVPCGNVLQVFDQKSSDQDVEMRYHRRKVEREERERFAKHEALMNAMCFTEEQHEAYINLCRAIRECESLGLKFAYDGDNVHMFRVGLIKDITNDMAPMRGQIAIDQRCLMLCITSVWNAPDGLYANVR